MRFLILLGLLALATANRYNGYTLFELSTKTRAATAVLNGLPKNSSQYELLDDLEFVQGVATRVLVSPNELGSFLNLLKTEHIEDYKILNHDFGFTLKRDYNTNRNLRKWFPYDGRLGTERYYSHDEINQYITDLSKQYPKRVFVRTVGRTYEGRWLKTVTIMNGDGRRNKNVIVMDGGIHAREWISPAAVTYAISQLVENFSENAHLLLDYDWVILPVINADGYEYTQLTEETRLWRKTRKPTHSPECIGTDPNRNFGYHWGESGSSPNPCASSYAGPKPFSEPEVVVVRDILHTYADRGQMYLTVHSYGSLILYPWGYADILPDTVEDLHEVAEVGQRAIKAVTNRDYTIGCSTQVLYAAAGASDDYAFSLGYPISFTMELPEDGPNGFDPPAMNIDALVKETWVGIRAMAQRVTEKYPLGSH